jgi:hypothetical protein
MVTCRQLGGEMPLPTSDTDLSWTFSSKNDATFNSTCFEGFWLPIVR